MFNSLLIVCIGNICRSPAVEKLFQQALKSKMTVSSAGLGALVGHGIDKQMVRCLNADGVNEVEHAARQFTRELAQEADIILVMEQDHVNAIQNIAPEAAGKTMLLGKWSNNEEIADPYKRSDEFFELIYKQMRTNVDAWAKKLG